FGLSDHLASDDYTPEHALELVERVRANFHLDRFHVAGHSLGGFFAWYYAAHHPDRVDRLVLIDPIGYPQTMPAAASALAYPLLGEIVCLGAPRFLIERLLQTAYGDPRCVDAALIERSCALLSQRRNRVALIRTLRRLREYRNNFELCRSIALVRAPTLLLWGGRDRWVPPSLLQHWRRDLPAAQVKIYPALGHLPMEELPERTARDVHAFLSEAAQPALSEETSPENVRRERIAHARGA
ncbi:MAG TPA: alpha/beta hydrolase, partial [Polyangiaceae bacterium]|nr:alpha/beta hydrolase [Polyangiaceae bacterium]